MDLGSAITVVLARFEDLVNVGLHTLIERDPNLRIVAPDVSVDQLDVVIAKFRPRVTVLNLEALRSPSEVRRLHGAHPDTRIVVLATRPSPGECSQLIALGATACLGKEVESRDVLNAIHLASRGLHVLPHAESGGATANDHEVLTPRETDVLDHLRRGRSNGEIAAALSVSIETVRTHARSVFRKLGVHNRRELNGLSPRSR
jgi:DNA-binding NarL/FixJ family response regulator